MAAPVANLLVVPTAGTVPVLVEVDATGSTGADSYVFTWGDGETTAGNEATGAHTYIDAYTGPVTLTVINADGTDTTTVHVTLVASVLVLSEIAGKIGVDYNPPKTT
jgi:PKD repeat protein